VWTTEYLFDTFGRLQRLAYPDGEILSYGYDAGGNVSFAQGVKQGQTFTYLPRLEYDKFEQRAYLAYGNGATTQYAYDARNRRLATLQAATQGRTIQNLAYRYDNVGNILGLANHVPVPPPNLMGGPTDQRFGYDDLYRLTQATGTWDYAPNKQQRYSLAMTYDSIHNIRSKTQLDEVVQPGGQAIAQKKTSYDWTYEYASSHPHAPTHLGQRSYTYDANGNQLGWDNDQNGTRRHIVWDEDNRIQSVFDNGHEKTYQYDDSGERVIKRGPQGETAYVNQWYTVRNREVASKHVWIGTARIATALVPGVKAVPGKVPGYGNNGNGNANSSNKDHANGPLLASSGSTLPLTAQQAPGILKGQGIAHRSAQAAQQARNLAKNPHYAGLSGSGSAQGSPGAGTASNQDNFLYYYHPDHLGSSSYVTDASGKVFEHLEYFPFGETWVEESSNTQRTPYLFTAKELDEETGLYYFGARYYDPRTSVWQSADPILGKYLAGAAGGVYESSNLGLYSYGRNNPVIFKDPDGNIVPLIMGAIWLGGAAMTAYDTYQTYKHEGAKAAAVELAKGAVITAATGGAVKLAVKGFKIANDVYHVVKTTRHLQQHVNEVAKAVDETVAAGKSAKVYSINSQKQAGHVPGTPQNVNRVKQGKPTSTFFGQQSGEMATQIANERGAPIPGRPNVKEYDFRTAVGVGPNGGAQTRVRVHTSPKTGEIHGHPSGPEKF